MADENFPAHKHRIFTNEEFLRLTDELTDEIRYQIVNGENYHDELIDYQEIWHDISNQPFTGSRFERMFIFSTVCFPSGVTLCFEDPDEVNELFTVKISYSNAGPMNGELNLGILLKMITFAGGEYRVSEYFERIADIDDANMERPFEFETLSTLVRMLRHYTGN